jgi:hypothetical protein
MPDSKARQRPAIMRFLPIDPENALSNAATPPEACP